MTNEPAFRDDARLAIEPFEGALSILSRAVDLSYSDLTALSISARDLVQTGSSGFLPIAAARAIGTTDAVHSVLSIGRVEQAEILNRSLSELERDTLLILGDDRAFAFYADWVRVEQARLALQVNPGEMTKDLELRRADLAAQLLDRALELDLRLRLDDDHDEDEDAPEDKRLRLQPLEVVLGVFSKARYGTRRPASWHQGFRNAVGIDGPEFLEHLAQSARAMLIDSSIPDDIKEGFLGLYRRELEIIYTQRTSESHNSPLAMNSVFSNETYAIRLHGAVERFPAALLGAFSHLYRMMTLIRGRWLDGDLGEWLELTERINLEFESSVR